VPGGAAALGFCGNPKLIDESLVVNPDNNGVRNVSVYLYVKGPKPTIHPAFKDRPKTVRLHNKGCRYEPRITAMSLDQTLVIGNLDKDSHNSKLDPISEQNKSINPIIPSMKTVDYTFNVEERLPVPTSCNLHPWMGGYVLVRETPYFAVTDKDGNFEIKNLPAGKWTFRFWQESIGYVQKVKYKEKTSTWKRGEVTVEIKKDGAFDMEDIVAKF
jgi:hypothetical protein